MRIRRFMTLLMVGLLLAGVFPPVTALAVTDISSLAVTTERELIITTASGTIISPDSSGGYTNVPKDARLQLRYAFALPNDNGLDEEDPGYLDYEYVEGDYIDVQLPYAVAFEEPAAGWDVLDKGGNVMGLLTIGPDGLTRITFTSYVQTHSFIEGWFALEGSFEEGTFTGGDPVQIDVEFAGETTTVGFLEDEDDLSVSVDKSGTYDPATNRITWQFTVEPSRALDAVKIVDTFSNNQTYVPGSFRRGTVEISDDDLEIVSGTSTTAITYDGVPLGGTTTFSYQTAPTGTAFTAETGSAENVVFRNDVDIYDGSTPLADDDADVTINWIQKAGAVVGTSVSDSRLIKWTVTVNSNGYDISDCILTDTLPKDLALFVDATHPVMFGATPLALYTGTGTPGTNTYTYAAGANDTHVMTIYLGDLDATGTLTFYTRVTNEDYFTGNTSTTLTNGIRMDWEENGSGEPSDSWGVGVGLGLIAKSAGSTVRFTDETTSTITWTVAVNRNQIGITNAVFTDEIPAGLEYVAGSFTINDPHDTLPDTLKGAFSYTEATRLLKYEFGSGRTISSAYTITFQTKITDYSVLFKNQNNLAAYSNTAKLTGGGMAKTEYTSTGTQRYNAQMVAKSVLAGYDYTTKLITWQIVVNRNSMPIGGAVLSDTLPAGLAFLPDTFALSDATLSTAALSPTVHSADDAVSQDAFSYTFPAGYHNTCTITYQTRVKEAALLTQGTLAFSNTALLTQGSLTASSTVIAYVNNTVVYKDMEHLEGADYLTWKIDINAGGISMTGIDVSDVLQEGLEIDLGSAILYPMTLNADGTLTRGSTPVSSEQYSVTYDETKREMTLRIPGTITGPYRLEFVTDITTSPLTIRNTVTLKGTSYTAESVVEDVTVRVSSSGIGGSGIQGRIVIEKIGESQEPLSGAEFTLYNNRGEALASELTDEYGRVEFGSLPIRSYIIMETNAPEGHVRSSRTLRVRMGTGIQERELFYQWENEKIRADLAVFKTGVDDMPLSGAEFTLYDSEGGVVDVKTTGTDGRVVFENLVYGSYTLVETRAPRNYIRAEESYPIVVASVDQIDLTVPNVYYEIPQLGGLLDTWLLLALSGMLVLGGAVWLVLRRRAHARG